MSSEAFFFLATMENLIFNNSVLQISDLLKTRDVAVLITKCHQDGVILSGWISFSLPHADFDL